jgi:hypothetical protein
MAVLRARSRAAALLLVAALFAGGCSTVEQGVSGAAKGFEDFRQGLRDAQAERDRQAAVEQERAEREQAEAAEKEAKAAAQRQADARRELERTDPALFRVWQRWADLRPRYQGPRFSQAPRAAAPYAAGALSAGLLEDGLNATRFVRFLAGVPEDVELSAELCAQAQHGAVVMAANNVLSHSPARPADMGEAFYARGLASTQSSNIHWTTDPADTLVSAVRGFMDDSDPGNIDRVGHRRWVLSPVLKKVGFGSALSRDGGVFTTMQVFDNGNAGRFAFDVIRWPAEGVFPVELFGARQAWSVGFNPERLQVHSVKDVRVKIQRKSDGALWEITSRSGEGSYLTVDTVGYGYQSALIFRPGNGFTISAGDTFAVSVTGLSAVGGAARPLAYEVRFVSFTGLEP